MTKRINRDYVETPTRKDALHKIGSCIANSVPGCGELFDFIFSDPAVQRRDDWIESLEQKILALENEVSDIKERIKNNENAISAAFSASSIALKTTNRTKLNALQNIIINAALHPDYEEYKIQMFLSIVDSFTEWHILLLEYFDNPKNIVEKHNLKLHYGTNNTIPMMYPFWEAYPNMQKQQAYIHVIIDNLFANGLITVNGDVLNKIHSERLPMGIFTKSFGPLASKTTPLGKELLSFIDDK